MNQLVSGTSSTTPAGVLRKQNEGITTTNAGITEARGNREASRRGNGTFNTLSRREFLAMAGASAVSLLLPRWPWAEKGEQRARRPNAIAIQGRRAEVADVQSPGQLGAMQPRRG
jgi:hypothetical protein